MCDLEKFLPCGTGGLFVDVNKFSWILILLVSEIHTESNLQTACWLHDSLTAKRKGFRCGLRRLPRVVKALTNRG